RFAGNHHLALRVASWTNLGASVRTAYSSPYAGSPRSRPATVIGGACSSLRRQNNAIDLSFGSADLRRRTNVGASIGCRNILDRFLRHFQPGAIHFHLIVIIDHAGFGRTTV